jgi:hypothetical protein
VSKQSQGEGGISFNTKPLINPCDAYIRVTSIGSGFQGSGFMVKIFRVKVQDLGFGD